MAIRHLIIDDEGVLWSSDSFDAFEEGSSIMAAVNEGTSEGYKPFIGDTWTGDLVFVKELCRTR